MLYLLILVCTVISAILYRAGGMDKKTKHWIPVCMRHSWVRDWLCPICILLPLFVMKPSWWFFLAYGALGGMLTTYWDWLFGYDCFWFSGLMCGLVGLFLIGAGFAWYLLLVRAVILGMCWGVWCGVFGNDFVEEYGRGALLVFPVTLMFI